MRGEKDFSFKTTGPRVQVPRHFSTIKQPAQASNQETPFQDRCGLKPSRWRCQKEDPTNNKHRACTCVRDGQEDSRNQLWSPTKKLTSRSIPRCFQQSNPTFQREDMLRGHKQPHSSQPFIHQTSLFHLTEPWETHSIAMIEEL